MAGESPTWQVFIALYAAQIQSHHLAVVGSAPALGAARDGLNVLARDDVPADELVAHQVRVVQVQLQGGREAGRGHLEAEAGVPVGPERVAHRGGAAGLAAEAQLAEGVAGAEPVRLGQVPRGHDRHLQLADLRGARGAVIACWQFAM